MRTLHSVFSILLQGKYFCTYFKLTKMFCNIVQY
uniref:Uncharacterized protein n=1 Tax=Anguilla anguilla TaxID=7936 RepID=A0A0E9V817_ANGAN